MLLDGVHVPLTTPFYPDGRVYFRKLEHNVRRYSLTPVSGLLALGENSEADALTDEERVAVLRTVAETAAPEKVLSVSVGYAGVLPSVTLLQQAAALRFDVAVLQCPASLAGVGWRDGIPTTAMLTWFRAIADASPLPLVLHGFTAGADLPVPTLAELAEHPQVIGVLERGAHVSRVVELRAVTAHLKRTATTTTTFTAATGRMLQPAQAELPGASGAFVSAAALSGGAALAVAPSMPALRTRTKEVGLQVLWGGVDDVVSALRAGASGVVSTVAAAVPQAVFEVWAAWKDGDASLMAEKQERARVAEQFLLPGGAPAVKAGAELSGYFGGRPRLPLVALDAAQQEQAATVLRSMRS